MAKLLPFNMLTSNHLLMCAPFSKTDFYQNKISLKAIETRITESQLSKIAKLLPFNMLTSNHLLMCAPFFLNSKTDFYQNKIYLE